MSALEALDRYIEQHEVTLQSISKQKLSRKPAPAHNEPASLTNASQFDISMGYACRPSIATELQNMIMRLQHIQQSRLSQLQQANALFLHEMNIEDQFNMEVKTEQEYNNELAEDEFEAFLLGEKPTSEEQSEAPKPAEEVRHSTLFTRTNQCKPSDQNTQPKSQNLNVLNEQHVSTDGKVEQEELSMSFTDDVVLQLQRSRQERTQRLRNIATSIQCTSAQSTQYPLSTFKTDVLNLSKLPSMPAVSDLSQSSSAKAPHGPANLSNYPMHTVDNTERGSLSTTHEAPITLQSILDDEQFAVTLPGTTVQETFIPAPPAVSIEHQSAVENSNVYSVDSTQPLLNHLTTSNKNDYLINNQSRKAIEAQLVERSKQNLNLANHSVNHNKADKLSHMNVREAPIPPRSPRATVINPGLVHSDQDNVHGIGYGSRYEHTIHGNTEVDRWDESSVGSADGSVRSLDQHFIAGAYNNTDSTNYNNNHSSIFDYADALESPQRKSHSSRTVTHTTSTASTKRVVFADTTDAPMLQRAVEVEGRVSRYYKQRMHRLEFGTELVEEERANVHENRSLGSVATMDNFQTSMHSPERQSKLDRNFESPLPKTPTFPPVFS